LDLPAYVRFEAPRAGRAEEPALSVVIPAYNEAERIGPYLEAIAAFLQAAGEPHEILVVDDGSRDGTADLIRRERQRLEALGLLTYEPNRGKGHAVRTGFLAARGKLRLFADADGSTPIAELLRLRSALEQQGCDLAIGSRALPAPGIERRIKPHRYLIGQVFRVLREGLLHVSVVDSQCGFKLLTAEAARIICPAARVDGFAFDVEWLYLAARAGLRVAEVPVNWHDSQSSRVNLLTDPWRMTRDMLRIRRLHRDTVLAPRATAPADRG